MTNTADYMRTLRIPGLHYVGGAVRDELLGILPHDYDFIAIGQSLTGIRSILAEYGQVENLVVADRLVGVRLWPSNKEARALAPKGIEIVPPRIEVSTGPGHKDFNIVTDPDASFEQDALRRDFTINAMARSLETNELLDPLNGQDDLMRGILRITSHTSFRDDPLRIIRGLRFVSELGFRFSSRTTRFMEHYAPGIEHLSGERIKDQMDLLLMGSHPASALRMARDTGVLAIMFPELADTIGFEQMSKFHDQTCDEHIFSVVQTATNQGAPLEVRWAALLHDSGKPESAWMGEDGRLHYYENPAEGKRSHEDIGAENVHKVMRRLAAPVAFEHDVRWIVQHHMFQEHNTGGRRSVRRFLAKHGETLAHMLIAHKRADITGKDKGGEDDRLDAFETILRDEIDAGNAFTVKQLRINGNDLAKIGIPRSPVMGEILRQLLDEVLDDPELNHPGFLRIRAEEMMMAK